MFKNLYIWYNIWRICFTICQNKVQICQKFWIHVIHIVQFFVWINNHEKIKWLTLVWMICYQLLICRYISAHSANKLTVNMQRITRRYSKHWESSKLIKISKYPKFLISFLINIPWSTSWVVPFRIFTQVTIIIFLLHFCVKETWLFKWRVTEHLC